MGPNKCSAARFRMKEHSQRNDMTFKSVSGVQDVVAVAAQGNCHRKCARFPGDCVLSASKEWRGKTITTVFSGHWCRAHTYPTVHKYLYASTFYDAGNSIVIKNLIHPSMAFLVHYKTSWRNGGNPYEKRIYSCRESLQTKNVYSYSSIYIYGLLQK